MKILLIEDNKEISKNIWEYFELLGHKIEYAFDWETGLFKALAEKYDIIFLDIMMPKIDGFFVAKKIREKSQTPIIITTAKWEIEDKLKGFELWVSDYIVKPFDLRELEARANALTGKNNSSFISKNLELDFEKRIFKKNLKEIHLSNTEILILEFLFSNKEKSVSRTDIIEHIWWENGLFESDWKLDVYISNLRKKLGKELIETQKGFGYRFGG